MSIITARRSVNRQIVITVESEIEQASYLVDWPLDCKLTMEQIYEGMDLLETINDMVNCSNCAYYQQECFPEKPRLHAREVNGGEC